MRGLDRKGSVPAVCGGAVERCEVWRMERRDARVGIFFSAEDAWRSGILR